MATSGKVMQELTIPCAHYYINNSINSTMRVNKIFDGYFLYFQESQRIMAENCRISLREKGRARGIQGRRILVVCN
ncbi:hypothetical protein GXY_15212 [Novacetimonas hansenii ATCC 23769]|uniref:Uncharacterized protein n=1 Tax=Novacetimonas hansenii ATCC 23769 TaxID=714995 RepID=D5QIR1_NOVHA|nr:hypothetical protein GXY_15212 [Novacetimonas hansenii ATCC 23769]